MIAVPADARPGDIIAVDTGDSAGNIAIRAGQLLNRRRWSWANHILMFHHVTDGVRWGIEGRPGGVGWVDLSSRTYRHLSTNIRQPKTDQQRAELCEWAERTAFGRPYDWDAIESQALQALGIPDLWRADWDGKGVPGQVVCSSLWAAGYDRVGLLRPLPTTGGRYVMPLDWDRLNRSWP